MDKITNTTSDVVVVDPQPQDYETLVLGASQWNLRIRLFTSGDEAIRAPTALFDGLWVVNMQLPDMSGVDLLLLVRERDPNAAVFLVGDSYDHEDEISARSSGSTAYICKPVHPAWLSSVRPRMGAKPTGRAMSARTFTERAANY